jgi:hypothetical protein
MASYCSHCGDGAHCTSCGACEGAGHWGGCTG